MKFSIQIVILIIYCLSTTYKLSAQVFPPDFLCIENDTLRWSPSNNSCGAFQGYEIYQAANAIGPYTLITTLADQNQMAYFSPNPAGLEWFYYILSRHDCPGQTSIPSDTLNNGLPDFTEYSSISVVGSDIQLTWEPNSSNQTSAYIIYRVTPIGTIPIDTVFGAANTSYLDTSVDANLNSETYFILALDPCGNTSLYGDPQSSLFLETSQNACLQQISMNWNAYAYPSNELFYEIWAEIDGAAAILIDSLDGNTTSYFYENIKDNTNYCLFVKARHRSKNYEAASNIVCLTSDVIQKIRLLYLKNLDVNPDGTVEVTWIWNNDAYLNEAVLLSSKADDDVVFSENITLNTPLTTENTFTFNFLDPNISPLSFSVSTIDECDTMVTTEFGHTIFLSISALNGLTNQLSWTPLIVPNATVVNYEIFKQTTGIATGIGQVDSSTVSFDDQLNANQVTDESTCYYVRAESELMHPDGQIETIYSNSNVVCQQQSALIFMPNAFAPRGRNQIFKPIVSYGTPKEFSMKIFNRWGQMVFETSDIENGWNGKIKDRDAPMGVYSYILQMKQQDNSLYEQKGQVMLVR